MKRVVHLVSGLDHGGIEMWLLSMLRRVQADRYRMDVVCKGSHAGALAGEARRAGACVEHIPLRPTHVGFVRGFSRLLQERGYDLVHVHLGAYSGLPVWLANRTGVATITTFHNTSFPPQTWTRLPGIRALRRIYSKVSVGHALRKSTFVTGVSAGVIETLDPGMRRTQNRARILRHGVDLPRRATRSERAAFRRENDIPVHAPVVAHVGSFTKQKNHGGLLKVFTMVRARRPDAHLLLIGSGPLKHGVEAAVASGGLGSVVRFLGTRDDVPAMLARADLFLFPSTHEGFGLAAIEAQAAGLPVVGSAIPGLDEAVEDGMTGFLHPVSDVTAMARSVERLLSDSDLRTRMGKAARNRVSREFSLDVAAEELVSLYDDALGLAAPLPERS